MLTTATQNMHDNAHEPVLFMAFELREKTWKLGCTRGDGQPPRERTIAARDPQRLLHEVAHAKARLGLGTTAPVVSCYEAGRAFGCIVFVGPRDHQSGGRCLRHCAQLSQASGQPCC